jgi:hypothetical protein
MKLYRVVAVGTAVALTACTASHRTSSAGKQTLVVRVFQIGGVTTPPGETFPPPAPLTAVSVTVTDEHGKVAIHDANKAGNATFSLIPGTYTVLSTCGEAHQVTIATRSARLDIDCAAA